MIKLKLTGNFQNDYDLLVEREPELKPEITQSVKLFCCKPDDTRLENHALKKRMKGKWAFSVTDDIRIVYEWQGKNRTRFLSVGPHKKVYSRSN